jgi:hypothetical protein
VQKWADVAERIAEHARAATEPSSVIWYSPRA